MTGMDEERTGDALAHAEIAHRSNVTILSSPRSVQGRNGVTIQANLQPVGPLSLPTPGGPT